MISNQPNQFYPESPLVKFQRQMEHLANNYKVIPLEELVRRLRGKRSVRGCAVITFDDGFKDNYVNAYPILKRLGLPATIFLSTGYIDSGAAPWFIRLRHTFMKTEKDHFHLKLGSEDVDMSMKTLGDKFKASDRIMADLKSCPDSERMNLLERLGSHLEVNSSADLQGMMLEWNEIREMGHHGISFGAHTVNHPVLSRVSIDVAEKEIRDSKARIEEEIVRPVTCFAYPFGRREQYSPYLFPVLKSLGFACAVTTEHGANGHAVNLYELKRSSPWELSFV